MNPDEKRMLRKNVALSEENNKMLKKLYSALKWGRAVRVVYWVIIIGIAVGVFVFLQPLVAPIIDAYNSILDKIGIIGETAESVKEAADSIKN